ncbi:hypothetical protein [Halovivax gelatinilyticus]|uniref:hypothetical protein n=1 Tax=Halovivax gelatinilyticus TaxID=2961597 RepID=UPI0020CA3CA3|nr:hypothetical protein [Halovivax gelatinilyticus]
MTSDSPKWTDPDPHYSTEWSIPEGNARRWAVLAFLGFWVVQFLVLFLVWLF